MYSVLLLQYMQTLFASYLSSLFEKKLPAFKLRINSALKRYSPY